MKMPRDDAGILDGSFQAGRENAHFRPIVAVHATREAVIPMAVSLRNLPLIVQ